MNKFKSIKHKYNNKNTIIKKIIIVFFCILVLAIMLFNTYGNKNSDSIKKLVNQKLNKFLYEYFNEKINEDVVKIENNDLLTITKNNRDEIITVDYNLEESYKMLSKISNLLKSSINDLENGKIEVSIYDKYLENGKNGLILNVPFFLYSNNIFLNNLGPKIPVMINFNESLLTNIKTKVTNYGFNNALLELYITVEMQKLIITPIYKDEEKFNYEILIGAKVVHGSVPEFYGNNYEVSSGIFDIPINK